MTLDQVQLYKQRYQGIKVTFNSRKQAGKLIKGIAVFVDPVFDTVTLRDDDNFPHCVSILTLEQI
jgi:hypothetical protein